MEQIKNLWFDGNRIYMRATNGKVFSRPLKAYPELEEATMEQRNDFTIDDDGMAIRWARYLGINKSLLARYIYGISKPSAQRLQQLRDALHTFGKELQSA